METRRGACREPSQQQEVARLRLGGLAGVRTRLQEVLTAYIGQERAAKAAQRGLWRGDFVAPWD